MQLIIQQSVNAQSLKPTSTSAPSAPSLRATFTMLGMQRGVRSMGTRLRQLSPGYRRGSSLVLRRLPLTANRTANSLAPAPDRVHHPVPFREVIHRRLTSAPGTANVQVTLSNSGESGNGDSDHDSPETEHRVRSDKEIEEEILALQSDLRTHHRHAVYDR